MSPFGKEDITWSAGQSVCKHAAGAAFPVLPPVRKVLRCSTCKYVTGLPEGAEISSSTAWHHEDTFLGRLPEQVLQRQSNLHFPHSVPSKCTRSLVRLSSKTLTFWRKR